MADYLHLETKMEKMKVAYIVPGSGGSFYCGNCHRDRLYVLSIKEIEGITLSAVPIYLPPIGEDFGDEFENPVFFGAVSMFLRERVKMFEHMPSFMDKIFDSSPLLKLAAKKAGATRAEGFEETTLKMIKGNDPARNKEIARLSAYLSESGKPDIVHLSNALIMGLANQIRDLTGSRIICSLQNEDDWIEKMAEPYRSQAWSLIGKESDNIDFFISPSKYFKNFIVGKTGIKPEKIHVVPSGIEESEFQNLPKQNNIPTIGFYNRLSYLNGLDKLVDAYILIMRENKVPSLQLHLCGGYTSDNKSFVKEQFRKLRKSGFDGGVKLYSAFHGRQKEEFFSSIDIMSVPVRKPDAYGLYLLIANSAGVPVVQPRTGAFPEIIEMTLGGIIYHPDTVEQLTLSLTEAFMDREKLNELGASGKKTIPNLLSTKSMAQGIVSVYKKALG